MAVFNPQTDIQAPPDETNRSRPIPVNRSGETLFSGIGTAIGDVAKGVSSGAQYLYEADKTDLYNKIFDQNTVQNDKYGVGVEGATLTGAQKPQALDDTQSKMMKVQAARSQGVITDAMYWAQVNVAAKEVRARYPDWNQEIDQIFNEVTGNHTVQGQLRNSIDREIEGKQAKGFDEDKKMDNLIYQDIGIVELVHPGASVSVSQMSTTQKQQLVTEIGQYKAKKLDFDTKMERYKMDDAAGNANKHQAEQLYGQGVTNAVQTAIAGSLNATGQSDTAGSLTSTFKQYIGPNAKAPDAQAVIGINQLLDRAEQQVQEEIMKLNQSAAGLALDPKARKEQTDAAMEPLKLIREAVSNKEYGLANRFALANKMGEDQDMVSLRTSNAGPYIRSAQVLNKVAPTIMQSFILQGGKDPYTEAIAPNSLAHILMGGGTIDKVNQNIMDEKNASPAQKNSASTKVLQGVADAISGGKAPRQMVMDTINGNFDKENGYGDSNAWALQTSKGKERYFQTFTSPQFVQSVIDTKDPKTIDNYRQYMIDRFGTLPSVVGMANDISNSSKAAGLGNTSYQYSPSTHQFRALAPIGQGITSEQRANMQEGGTANLSDFNAALSDMANFMKKTGIDPNGPEGFPHLFKNLNLGSLGAVVESGAIKSPQDAIDSSGATIAPKGSRKAAQSGSLSNYAALRSQAEEDSAADAITQNYGEAIDPKADEAARSILADRSLHGASAVDGMRPVLRTRLADLIASAPPDIAKGLGIYSGYRSTETQATLFANSDGSGKMVARPGHSLHEQGLAADLSYNGVSLAKAPPEVIEWVKENVGKVGLKLPMSYENWHVEPIETRGGKGV